MFISSAPGMAGRVASGRDGDAAPRTDSQREGRSLNCVSNPTSGRAAASFLLSSSGKIRAYSHRRIPTCRGTQGWNSGGVCCFTKLTPGVLAPCVGSAAIPSRARLGAAASPGVPKMSFSSPKESTRWVMQGGGCIPSWN